MPPTQEILEVAKVSSQKHSLERTTEQTDNVPVPQVVKQTLEVVTVIPQKRIVERTMDSAGFEVPVGDIHHCDRALPVTRRFHLNLPVRW